MTHGAHTGLRLLVGAALLFGGSPAAAEPCQDLDCVPLAQAPPSYWDQWRSATDQVMAGRGASALYRDTANRMRAWWALYEYDRETPWLDEDDAARARDLAQIGTIAGLESMLRQTFERSEELGVVYRIGKTISGADLEFRTRKGQGWGEGRGESHTKVRYNAQSTAQLRASQAELDDDRAASPRVPEQILRTGVALQLVDVAEDEDELDPELMLTTYLDLRRLGIDALRLQLGDTWPGSPVKGKGSWSVSARQGLLPTLDAFARLTGRENRTWRPSRASSGLSLRLPTPAPWYLRSELSRAFPTPLATGEPTVGEWRGMVYLRAQLRWELPASNSGWPLGQVVDPANRELLPD